MGNLYIYIYIYLYRILFFGYIFAIGRPGVQKIPQTPLLTVASSQLILEELFGPRRDNSYFAQERTIARAV